MELQAQRGDGCIAIRSFWRDGVARDEGEKVLNSTLGTRSHFSKRQLKRQVRSLCRVDVVTAPDSEVQSGCLCDWRLDFGMWLPFRLRLKPTEKEGGQRIWPRHWRATRGRSSTYPDRPRSTGAGTGSTYRLLRGKKRVSC